MDIEGCFYYVSCAAVYDAATQRGIDPPLFNWNLHMLEYKKSTYWSDGSLSRQYVLEVAHRKRFLSSAMVPTNEHLDVAHRAAFLFSFKKRDMKTLVKGHCSPKYHMKIIGVVVSIICTNVRRGHYLASSISSARFSLRKSRRTLCIWRTLLGL